MHVNNYRDPLLDLSSREGKVKVDVAKNQPVLAAKARASGRRSGGFLGHKWYLLSTLITED